MHPYRLKTAHPKGIRCSEPTYPSKTDRSYCMQLQRMPTHHELVQEEAVQESTRVLPVVDGSGPTICAHAKPRSRLEQRELVSRARAQELSIRYELSEFNAMSLIKVATFPLNKEVTRGTPSLLAGVVTTKKAAELYALNESRKQSKAQTDPLLTESERLSQLRKEKVESRIAQLNAQFSPASQLSRAPFGLILPSQQQSSNAHLGAMPKPQLSDAKKTLFHTLGSTQPAVSKSTLVSSRKVMPYPTTPEQHSVASTFIETPSPIVFHASNGKRYEVCNMC